MFKQYRLNLDKDNDNKRTLMIVSGMHGNESHAVKQTFDLLTNLKRKDSLERKTLSESFKYIDFFIGVNEEGLKCNVREYVDSNDNPNNMDLNRFYNTEDSSIEDLQDFLNHEVEIHDIIVDVHNSPNIMDMVLLDTTEKTSCLLPFLRDNEINSLIRLNGSPLTLKSEVNKYNDKYGFTVELNQMGLTSEEKEQKSASFLMKFLLALVDFTEKTYMINEEFEDSDDEGSSRVWLIERIPITRDMIAINIPEVAEGIKYYKREEPLGEYEEGEVICEIVDFENDEVVDTIKAPFDGILQELDTSYISTSGGVFGMYSKSLY